MKCMYIYMYIVHVRSLLKWRRTRLPRSLVPLCCAFSDPSLLPSRRVFVAGCAGDVQDHWGEGIGGYVGQLNGLGF